MEKRKQELVQKPRAVLRAKQTLPVSAKIWGIINTYSLKFSGRAHCQGTEHTGGNPSPAQIAVQGFGVCPAVPHG